jgi:hypothetical protein
MIQFLIGLGADPHSRSEDGLIIAIGMIALPAHATFILKDVYGMSYLPNEISC